MRRKSRYEELLDQGTDLVRFYRNHPVIAAYDLLNVDLAPIQRLVFRDMWFKNYVIAVCTRGYGKTFMLGTLAALSSLLYPGYRVGLIAPVFRQCMPIDLEKSNTYSTFWTSDGMFSTVEDFYDSVKPNMTNIQSLSDNNLIINKWINGKRPCINVQTEKGYFISGTVDHKIKVLGPDFSIIDKELKDVVDSDYLVLKTDFNYFGDNDSMPPFDEFEHNWRTKDCLIPERLDVDLAYWMGLLVGDGCVSISKDKRRQRIGFVSEDQNLLDSFEGSLRKYFLVNKDEKIGRYNRKNNTWEIEYYCKKLVQYLLKCGFTKTTALDKKVPNVVKKASRDVFIAFLQGLFDTDGSVYIQNHKNGYPHCEVNLSTSSKQLAIEVQSILLNLGIVSNLNICSKECIRQLSQGNKPSKCAEGYKVRISGYEDLNKFSSLIGFRLRRKSILLSNYVDTMNLKRSNRFVPNVNGELIDILNHVKFYCARNTENNKIIGKLINSLKSGSKRLNLDTIHTILKICNEFGINYEPVSNLKAIVNESIVLVRPKKFKHFTSHSIDIEVANEHCYWANGFINHNSKMIFSEVEKLYARSSLFREACEKRPIRGPDSCYVKFKSVGGTSGSFIESLPLGDGSKIRGSRFYLIVIDELAQVPDQTLDMVVRPMAATTLEPMENVRRIERQEELIRKGLATEEDFEEDSINKMIMTSSGYYKFNHMWRRMRDYWVQMDLYKEKSQYSVWQVPYWDLPRGFLDVNNVEEAKRIMSSHEFSMEYEAAMISDSEGFFKASLLEDCTRESEFRIELKGDPNAQYVLGIDPNQGGSASCGVVLIKLGQKNKVVAVFELKNKITQEMAMEIQNLCEKYNIIRIFMDRGGGGNAVKDLLEEGYGGKEPIIDLTNEEHKRLPGRHILEMVNFNPAWITDANFATLALLEDKRLLFPNAPTVSTVNQEMIIYDSILSLKSQMMSIVVTQNASGTLHFDTPKKGQNKDLYSAMILAAYGARIIEKELEEPDEPQLYNRSGMVRERKPGASWNSSRAVPPAAQKALGAALLKPKPK